MVYCKTGCAIPEPILAGWNKGIENQKLIDSLFEVRRALEIAQEAGDITFREVTFSTTIIDLNNAISQLRCSIPHAVCTTCAGHKPERCTFCKGRGWISKFSWNTHVPKEIREMRQPVAA